MTENELLLEDRLEVIRLTIRKYGEENFYIAFSGGKDSTVVHHLVDMALPNNNIPRVFSNTGIEYQKIVEFVRKKASQDKRFEMLMPKTNIKKMLEEKGYPFKSKEHSNKINLYKNGSRSKSVMTYKNGCPSGNSYFQCPNSLKYQYEDTFELKISDRCCFEMKKKPFHEYENASGKRIAITGMMRNEGGQRTHIECIVSRNDEVIKFHPLSKVSPEWETWFIEEHNIDICELYREPYNFDRTGCKGCPFNIHIQRELETLEKWFPHERKQCEYIWKPVYDEYRRIGYRLKKDEQMKLF